MLPCTEEEVEALFYFILFLIYTSLSTLFGPSRSPFLTSRRYTVREWHKRSLRVNTRLQRESAINTNNVILNYNYTMFISITIQLQFHFYVNDTCFYYGILG